MVAVGTNVLLKIPLWAAIDKILDEIDSAAVTGHTVVDRSIVSMTRTVLAPSGRLMSGPVLFLSSGQLVMVAAQMTAVRVEIVRTVSVVSASPPESVGDAVPVLAVTEPAAAAADRILDDKEAAAVTGQTVVDSWMVSVMRAVDTPCGMLVGMAELTGQFVTVGAQLTTVCIVVVRTVSVVSWSLMPEGAASSVPAGRLVEVVGLVMTMLILNPPSEGVGSGFRLVAEDVEPRAPLVLVGTGAVLSETSEKDPWLDTVSGAAVAFGDVLVNGTRSEEETEMVGKLLLPFVG